VSAATRLAWHGAVMAAFGATAAVAVTLSHAPPAPTAMTTATRQQQPTPSCAMASLAVSVAGGAARPRSASAGARPAQQAPAGGRPPGQPVPVDFTNTSGRACTIGGYPSVAAYVAQADGYTQVGKAASVDAAAPAHQVLLRPGATAHSDVVSSAAPGAGCRPASVSGLRVAPPGDFRPRYLPVRVAACAGPGRGQRSFLRVGAVEAGPGRERGPGSRGR
jgi:hypothetical protein